MKKIIISGLAVVMMVSLSACGKKTVVQNDVVQKGGFEVIDNNTLSGWLKRGKSVECSVETPVGEVVMLVQNGKMRMEGIPYSSPDSSGVMPKAENGVSLTVGDWMYLWDEETKKGTKMNITEMAAMGQETAEEEPAVAKTWEESVSEWEGADSAYSCKEKVLSGEIFEAPADVEFVDLTEMMRNMADFGKNMETQLETGEAVDLQALEAMAEKLKGPDGEPVANEGVAVPELE